MMIPFLFGFVKGFEGRGTRWLSFGGFLSVIVQRIGNKRCQWLRWSLCYCGFDPSFSCD